MKDLEVFIISFMFFRDFRFSEVKLSIIDDKIVRYVGCRLDEVRLEMLKGENIMILNSKFMIYCIKNMEMKWVGMYV